VLIIAGINFVTLSLGRSISRSKEIGIRKSIGAGKSQLVFQFMGEAILISLISTIIGVILAILGLPLFNELAGKEMVMIWNVNTISGLVSMALLIGLLSGIYPAFIMAGFNPISIVKGNLHFGKGKNGLRKVLVTGQFVMSIFLITTTLIMKNQLAFLQNKSLGFDKEHVLVVPISVTNARGLTEQVTLGTEKGIKLQRVLEGNSSIISSAISSHTFEPGNWTDIAYTDAEDNRYNFFFNTVTSEYIPTLGMELIAGRNFSKENAADATRSIIVNESYVKAFDLENPVGARIPGDDFIDHEIIGVVKDFHIESLHVEIAPLVLSQNVMIGFSGAHGVGVGSSPMPKVMVRVVPGMTKEAIEDVRSAWNSVYPGEPFDYSFIDENLKEQYTAENNFGRIMSSAAILAIIIGSLGLFGLSTLTMNARLREVSIRKVLGASGNNLLVTLNKGFVILIIVALLIASPFTYYAMNDWLSAFQYKIDITPGLFVAAGVLTILISLITVSYQTIRAIRTNPASVLRTE
jgi:putative ABC transport system permease protein